jgi:hypothetical protein
MLPEVSASALKTIVRDEVHDDKEVSRHPSGIGTGHPSTRHPQHHAVFNANGDVDRNFFITLDDFPTPACRTGRHIKAALPSATGAGNDLLHDESALAPLLNPFTAPLTIRTTLGLGSRLGAATMTGRTRSRSSQMQDFFTTGGHPL